MSFVEEKNLFHGDLRAKNILIAKNKVYKISGFRPFRAHENEAKDETTTRWSAPEILNGGKASVKSDIWSFGVVSHEIFTNAEKPYEGNMLLLQHFFTGSNFLIIKKNCQSFKMPQ